MKKVDLFFSSHNQKGTRGSTQMYHMWFGCGGGADDDDDDNDDDGDDSHSQSER